MIITHNARLSQSGHKTAQHVGETARLPTGSNGDLAVTRAKNHASYSDTF